MAETNKNQYYKYVQDTGMIVPDTADIKKHVVEEFENIFGEDLDTSPETPQGRLIEVHTLERVDTVRLNALVANQINPDVATGKFLDAICALTDCRRLHATHTQVEAVITGKMGQTIPAGARAATDRGDIFYLENAVKFQTPLQTDPQMAEEIVIFLSADTGPIPCPRGSLNQIIDNNLDWKSVSNSQDDDRLQPAVLGTDLESDRSLRVRRRKTLYSGCSYNGAIESALWRVPEVRGVLVMDNPTPEPLSAEKHGVAMKPHSIYACVHGGADEDVALALYKTKTVGAAYNGKHTITINDPFSHAEYDVIFDRPEIVKLFATVRIKANSPVRDIVGAVKNAIADWQAGVYPQIDGLNIGASVSPFELAAAVTSYVDGIFVKQVLIGTREDNKSTAMLEFKINQLAEFPPGQIDVIIE